MKRGLDTKMTPEVPIEMKAWPGSTTPSPQAEAALSPPPPATTGCFGIPQARATLGVSLPVASVPSKSAGIWLRDMSVATRSASDQARLGISIQYVPAESDMSEANSPVIRYRT